jgi:glucose/arabinose dehydrogenase
VLAFPKHHLPPGGLAVYSGRRVPDWAGNLFFASLRGETLVRVVLDPKTRTRPIAVERLFETDFGEGLYGRLRAVGEGPDGALYFGTSNRDGRGDPAREDDRIFRLTAAGG